jgi:hypothetical protein
MSSQPGQLKWHYRWLWRRLRRLVFSKLYRDSNRDLHRSILVAGTARSGTTWLGDILASQLRGRVMFEPFHSRKVKAYSHYHYFHYMHPHEKDEGLAAFCRTVFSGEIRDKWIDGYVEVLLPQYRIIKEIRANLLLKWIQNNFPQVPQLFIIRHPCAVVLSRMALNWDTDRDIESFLAQPKLVEDFLGEKLDVIKKAVHPEEKHAIIWCVTNLIPLRQFQENELNVLFYENLCTQPEVEIARLFQAIQLGYQDSLFNTLEVPSTTTRPTSAIVIGEDNLSRWQNRLHSKQIDKILNVVEAFGLEYLYGDSLIPQMCHGYLNASHI